MPEPILAAEVLAEVVGGDEDGELTAAVGAEKVAAALAAPRVPREGAMSPEERCRRVGNALAEAGWPDCGFAVDAEDPTLFEVDADVPGEVIWRALMVTGPYECCWLCWLSWDGTPIDCTHDPLTSEWTEVVR